MSEPAKVRCPNCENLFPELTHHSVYQCGGCGAVLHAKNNFFEGDAFLDKSDEEKVGRISDNFSEKSYNFKCDEFEIDVKSTCSSSSRDYKREEAESYRNSYAMKADKWVVDNSDLEMYNNTIDNLNYSNMGREFEEMKPQIGNSNKSQRSGRVWDWEIGDKGEMDGFQRTQRNDFEGMRDSISKYSEESPSNYDLGSSYSYGETLKNRNDRIPNASNRVECLEQDRTELLRKLDELNDQLYRSCDVVDKDNEKIPLDRKMLHGDPYGKLDGSWGLNLSSSQNSMPHKHFAKPHYIIPYAEPPAFKNRHGVAVHNYYHSMHTSDQVQGFGDPIRPQMLRKFPPKAPGPFQQPSHPYFSGQYVDNDMVYMDPFEPYSHNINLHHPSCSCVYCYSHQQVPPISSIAFGDKRFPDVPKNPMFYHQENPSAFDPRGYNPRIVNSKNSHDRRLPDVLNPMFYHQENPGAFDPRCYNYNPRIANSPLKSHNPQSHTIWPSDITSEVGGFARHPPTPPRVVTTTRVRRCRLVAGGAPIITCCNCFELLQLPKKVFLMDKSQNKMRCGACSSVILLAVSNKKLVVSIHVEAKIIQIDEKPNVAVNESNTCTQGHGSRASMNFSSFDYDNSSSDFQSMDREHVSSSTDGVLGSNKSLETRNVRSTSSCTSEDEDKPDSLNSTELTIKTNTSPPSAGSTLQALFDYSNIFRAASRDGEGNKSGRLEGEKLMPKKAASSMKDASVATEMEISSIEYGNIGTSQDSLDTKREEDQLSVNSSGESFSAGIIKNSSREFSGPNQSIEEGQSSVTVNGHPIPDDLVKKAGKLAGPIHPGQYWYDFRAGFWGVIGGPCRGIIPPFIEEFNYPMPKNCSGGNTGVFVNGREIHQKDLNLLGRRGLPTDRVGSYIIEISGRVLDEESGEELDSLGKLAPTVEKAKHGFGMKVPKAAAA